MVRINLYIEGGKGNGGSCVGAIDGNYWKLA
jgi:hypothetical protein